jgi:hypothetical protein
MPALTRVACGPCPDLIDVDAVRVARSLHMMDVLMLAIGLVFFVLSVGYCYACDAL